MLSQKDANPEGRQNVLGRPGSWCGQRGSCDKRVEQWVTVLRDDWTRSCWTQVSVSSAFTRRKPGLWKDLTGVTPSPVTLSWEGSQLRSRHSYPHHETLCENEQLKIFLKLKPK